MVTIKEKVANFARETQHAIFVIDQDLFNRNDHDIDRIMNELRRDNLAIFAADLWPKQSLTDFLTQALERKVIRSNHTPNGTQIISFLDTEKPIIAYLAPTHHHLLKNKDNDVWRDFALYHELFHVIDEALKGLYVSAFQPISISTIHRTEFFADFGSCLYLASKGHDLFMDVAKMRALNVRAQSHKNSFNLRDITYCNHRLYKAYEQSNLTPKDMDLGQIITATKENVERHAFTRHQLDFLRHSVKTHDSGSFEKTIRSMENIMKHRKLIP